ncbi:hypothetical protein [Streptomyces bambusae]
MTQELPARRVPTETPTAEPEPAAEDASGGPAPTGEATATGSGSADAAGSTDRTEGAARREAGAETPGEPAAEAAAADAAESGSAPVASKAAPAAARPAKTAAPAGSAAEREAGSAGASDGADRTGVAAEPAAEPATDAAAKAGSTAAGAAKAEPAAARAAKAAEAVGGAAEDAAPKASESTDWFAVRRPAAKPDPAAAESPAERPESAPAAPAKPAAAAPAAPAKPAAAAPAAPAKPAAAAPAAAAKASAEQGPAASASASASDADADADAKSGDPRVGGQRPGEDPRASVAAWAATAERRPAPAGGDTTVFRAVKKPGDEPAAEQTTVLKAVTPKPAPKSDETTVLKAVTPKPKPKPEPEPAPEVDQPTAVFRAPVVPKPAPGGEAEPAGGRPASTFVPLRSDDTPRTPAAPKPVTPYQPATPKASAPAPAPAAPKPPAGPAAPGKPTAPAGPSAASLAAFDEPERTKQQPLPPKPPLDMLADLTNNPPPPPSALRTTVRRFKIWTPLVLLLLIVFAVVQLVRPLPEVTLTMTADSSYTFDGGKPNLTTPPKGQSWMAASGLGTIASSGEQKPIPIASVTKSMTAYIILRDHPFKRGEKGAMIPIDETAEREGQKDKTDNESTMNTARAGDKISEYDAIAALMIPSANNIARLLARWDSGSQEAFVKKMNDTARELGMTNTTYTDPSGLDATTVSTAEDQVKLGLKLIEIPVLRDITKLPEWEDQYGKKWRNWNSLVPYNNSLGIKTGSTTAAGGNLLFAAHKMVGKTDQFIVGAVLGQHDTPILDTAIAASKKLMLETQDALTGAKVIKKGDVVGYVDDGLGGRTPVVAGADVDAVGWASLKVDVKLGGSGALPHSARAGTEVGTLTVGAGASQVKVPVVLRTDLAEPGFGSKLTRLG